jgi:hypothetical protein
VPPLRGQTGRTAGAILATTPTRTLAKNLGRFGGNLRGGESNNSQNLFLQLLNFLRRQITVFPGLEVTQRKAVYPDPHKL